MQDVFIVLMLHEPKIACSSLLTASSRVVCLKRQLRLEGVSFLGPLREANRNSIDPSSAAPFSWDSAGIHLQLNHREYQPGPLANRCRFTVKLPFPLTPQFKSMLQSGVGTGDLDVRWVSSLSWYFLTLFGLQPVYNFILGSNNGMFYSGHYVHHTSWAKLTCSSSRQPGLAADGHGERWRGRHDGSGAGS